MITKPLIACLGAWLCLLPAGAAMAQESVNVTCDVEGYEVVQDFSAGDIVPVTLWVSGTGSKGVLGLDLAVGCANSALGIHAVEFDPAFPVIVEGQEPLEPVQRFHVLRIQPTDAINHVLGANGQPIRFATLYVEVTRDVAFTSALRIRAHGSLVGQAGRRTIVFGGEASRGFGRITFRGLPGPQPHPYTTIDAPALLALTPVGGGAPVFTLAPHASYEVRYLAGHPLVHGFVLFSISQGAPDQTIEAAVAPPSGSWSEPEDFSFISLPATGAPPVPAFGYPEGYYRYALVSADLGAQDAHAGPHGHLCTITTQEPGQLHLHLFMWYRNEGLRIMVSMEARGEFTVAGP